MLLEKQSTRFHERNMVNNAMGMLSKYRYLDQVRRHMT